MHRCVAATAGAAAASTGCPRLYHALDVHSVLPRFGVVVWEMVGLP
jgi:hypothetical protein